MGGEIILYTTEDGRVQVSLRQIDGSVWLTQLQLAELFQTSAPNINQKIKEIIEEDEQPEATIKYHLIVQIEGSRTVERQVAHYDPPMILAIGFRVRSPRGTQFRRWAAGALSEYLVSGNGEKRLLCGHRAEYWRRGDQPAEWRILGLFSIHF